MPGENNVIKWRTDYTLQKILDREEGSVKPILVLAYDGNLSKDCCAANFERAVLRYNKVVDLARKFGCAKFERSAGITKELAGKFEIDPKKPVLMILDAEGGLLHMQQKCIDPKQYLKIMRSSFALNDRRVKFKQKYLAKHREARELMEKGEYARALRSLDRTLKKRNELLGSVLEYVEGDRLALEATAHEMFAKATGLRDQQERIAAYRMFKEIQREFAKLQGIGKEAGRCAKALEVELKRMGVTGL